MKITTAYGGITTICIEGKLDGANFPQFVRQVTNLLQERRPKLIVDLSEASDVSSSGLIALHVMGLRAMQAGGRLVLSGPRPGLARAMEVMGRGLPLTIYTDAEAAQSSFSTDRLQRVSRVQTDLTAGIAGAGVHP